VTAVAAGLTALFGVQLRNRADEHDTAHRQRLASFQAADQLRQSSDDLTNLARLNVVTGDDRFADWFGDVFAIGAGEQERPGGRANAASAASFTVQRMVIIVDTSTCHLQAASAWDISPLATCNKTSTSSPVTASSIVADPR